MRVVVLYDGQCPLCSREIRHYQRRKGADKIDWVDVTRDLDQLAAFGVSQTTALARFHVRDQLGNWQTGAAGFVLLWSQLPAYRWLAGIVRTMHLLSALEWGYVRFLRWRNRKSCDEKTCG